MKNIDKLSPKHIEQLPIWRDKWIAIGLSTEPADRQTAEEGIKLAYTTAKLAPPNKIIWTGSPLGNAVARVEYMQKEKVSENSTTIKRSQKTKVNKQISPLNLDVLASDLSKSNLESIRNSVSESGYGQHDAPWIGFYDFFREVVGLTKETESLVGITMITRSAGWYLPHQDICWIAERHNVLKRDTQGRLHGEDGPAVAYPDGWKIYAWHGVRIPDTLVEHPETYTADKVLKEPNAEVQRAMLEKLGWEKVWGWLGNPKPIHTDHCGELYKITFGAETIAIVKLTDPSTGRQYLRGVPPEMQRAKEAVAWTFSMDEKSFEPLQES